MPAAGNTADGGAFRRFDTVFVQKVAVTRCVRKQREHVAGGVSVR